MCEENSDSMELDSQSQQCPSPSATSNVGRSFGNPTDYMSTVLKEQLGNSPEFVAFERYFYYLFEEVKHVKNTCEELRTTVAKLQEEKRSLEHELITEKALREQESKNASMDLEKLSVQQNAQMYSMQCEVDMWKRKSEAMATESTWLKDQLKSVEMEKNEAIHKLTDLMTTVNDFERYRQSFESYSRRLKETMQNANKKLDELEASKEAYEKLSEANENQLNLISSKLRSWIDEKKAYDQKIEALEQELIVTKANLVQNNSKLERAEMSEGKTVEVVNKLLEENKDLLNGLQILARAQGEHLKEADKQLVERAHLLHKEMECSVKRLRI